MFKLSKWYEDCVSATGDMVIVYHADLRWGVVSTHYESVIEKYGDGEAHVSHRRAEVQFGARGPELRETIFACDEGRIEWTCVEPGAIASCRGCNGFGYREHLLMTLPPWKLPIAELHWGRYISESSTLTWIDWRGTFSNTIVYRDGRRVDAVHIGEERISLADGSNLTLDRGDVLRNGALGTTVLSAVPIVNRMVPARMLAVHECKWRSRAILSAPGRPVEESWAIHEVVRWP